MTTEHQEYIRQWIIKADEDIKVIDYLAAEDISLFTSAICFHAQQAVEKYLKAFLVSNEIDFRKTHDLDYLLAECKKINPIAFEGIELENLTEYRVGVRYPDDFIIPSLTDTNYFKELASQIKCLVEKLISEKLPLI